MKPVATVADMRAADARAAASDPSAEERLIARAGSAVAHHALGMLGGSYGRRVAVVTGPGNNGADGRVAAARLRQRGVHVDIVPAARRGESPPSLPSVDLVIDAAFGTGFSGDYAAPSTTAPILAVDIPSGVNGDTGAAGEAATRAAATVTFAALKPGLLLGQGPERCGPVTVADIGLQVGPTAMHLVEDADVSWLPARPRDTHKWRSAVFVVAGSPGMGGAAQLCARSAQRAGAGMVYVGSPGVAAAEHPPDEAVARSLDAEGWDVQVLEDLPRFRALVLGPGLGRQPAVVAAVRRLVATSPVPVVVDADGLNALGPDVGDVVAGAKSPVVLTPHDGEFARLAGQPPSVDRVAAVQSLAQRSGAVVLLKGSTTVVADDSGQVLLSTSGDARLATPGTGDVLAGMIGAFLADGLAPLRAAALGAHVHGRAASLGPSRGLVASDVAALVPTALAELGRLA